MTTRTIVAALGGRRTFAGRVRTWVELRKRVNQGLRYESLVVLSNRYRIAPAEMVSILGVPPRTLARRKRQKRFRPDESDRLVRVGRVAALAEDTLGDAAKAARWLHEPNRALGNESPLRQLDTDLGAREVEDTLLRIAHGVYS